MQIPPIVALEIGTTKMVALVGEVRKGGQLLVTGMGERQSRGIRKGEVIDIPTAIECLKPALIDAESSGAIEIMREVHLAISGGHVESQASSVTIDIRSRSGKIQQSDLEEALETAKGVSLPEGRRILDYIHQYYTVDGCKVPRLDQMEASTLGVNVMIIHAARTRMNNMVNIVKGVPMGTAEIVFSGLCSALAVLTREQKAEGAVVIDLGGGKTDYLAYDDGYVMSAGSIGVGGDHITNDIATAFSIPQTQAESIKRDMGSATAGRSDGCRDLDVPPDGGFAGRRVNVRSLDTVINARIDEILGMVKERLVKDNVLQQAGAGIILTGGGAHLRDVCELAESIFSMPVCVGKPVNVGGLDVVRTRPEYATAAGLLVYAVKTFDNWGKPGLMDRIKDLVTGG